MLLNREWTNQDNMIVQVQATCVKKMSIEYFNNIYNNNIFR